MGTLGVLCLDLDHLMQPMPISCLLKKNYVASLTPYLYHPDGFVVAVSPPCLGH